MQPTDEAVWTGEQTPPTSARLLLDEPGALPRVLLVAPGATMRIGRDEALEVQLAAAKVSRLHAVLHYDGSRLTVHDPGSRNGTFVGGERVCASPRALAVGDVLVVGDARLTLVSAPAPVAGLDVHPQARASSGVRGSSGARYVADDPASAALVSLARRLAASELPVLVVGETGVGKEGLARIVHEHSRFAAGPFVALNCATLPESLAESMLFGHEKGAFTGATARSLGVFEAAQGGTIFLDEVGELAPANQARLLRVLQERVLTRVGSQAPVQLNVRVIAATNVDLAAAVASRRFREDLYYRLRGALLEIAPLRARPRDVVPIAEEALKAVRPEATLSEGIKLALQAHRWPGNVRELRNAIEYAAAIAEGDELRAEHLPGSRGDRAIEAAPDGRGELRDQMIDVESAAIVRALDAAQGNQTQAARILGLPRRTLLYRMQRLGLKPKGDRVAPSD